MGISVSGVKLDVAQPGRVEAGRRRAADRRRRRSCSRATRLEVHHGHGELRRPQHARGEGARRLEADAQVRRRRHRDRLACRSRSPASTSTTTTSGPRPARWRRRASPKHLLVIGGGYIGLELGIMYREARHRGHRRRGDALALLPGPGARLRQADRALARRSSGIELARPRPAPRASTHEKGDEHASRSRPKRREDDRRATRSSRPSAAARTARTSVSRSSASKLDAKGFLVGRQAAPHQRAAHLRDRRHRRPADARAQGRAARASSPPR